jgi:hypothetical protein
MNNVKIYLRKYNSENDGIVWISFYVNREKVNFSTKVSVDEKNWNEKKSCVSSNDKNSCFGNFGSLELRFESKT